MMILQQERIPLQIPPIFLILDRLLLKAHPAWYTSNNLINPTFLQLDLEQMDKNRNQATRKQILWERLQ
jgi:hypothetical protein